VGMDHLCILMQIDFIERLMEYLQQAEVEIFWDPIERHGTTSVYAYDLDGMHVELWVDTAT
jgi:hypothetical protein